jgi:hypothetical protein
MTTIQGNPSLWFLDGRTRTYAGAAAQIKPGPSDTRWHAPHAFTLIDLESSADQRQFVFAVIGLGLAALGVMRQCRQR